MNRAASMIESISHSLHQRLNGKVGAMSNVIFERGPIVAGARLLAQRLA